MAPFTINSNMPSSPSTRHAIAVDKEVEAEESTFNLPVFVPEPYSIAYEKVDWETRCRAIDRDGYRCWLCGWLIDADMLNPIPNISTSVPKECSTPSAHMILQWQEMGILHEEFYPAHLDNLLTLCLNCEVIYMGVYPSYVVLPEDLDPFIQFETMDYAAREIAAKKGVEQKRSLPAIPSDGTLCKPYIINKKLKNSHNLIDWSAFPKRYFGWPQTLILRALGACFYPTRCERDKNNDKNEGGTMFSEDVLEKVMKLVSLWNRPDPEVRPGPVKGGGRKGKRKRSELKRGQNDSDRLSSENEPSLTKTNLKKQQEEYQSLGPGQALLRDPIPKRRALGNRIVRTTNMSSWAIGPDKSSSDMMAAKIEKWRDEAVEANRAD